MNHEQPSEVLADWQGSIRLVAATDHGQARIFAVEEFDDRGAVSTSTLYPYDGLIDAIDHYHRRWLEALDPPVAAAMEVGIRFVVANGDRDAETAASLVADNFTLVDYRDVGYPSLDKAGLVDAVVATDDGTRDRGLSYPFHAVSAAGSVSHYGTWMFSFDHWHRFEVGVWVAIVDDDAQLSHLRVFPPGQVNEALACFDELTRPR